MTLFFFISEKELVDCISIEIQVAKGILKLNGSKLLVKHI